MSKTRQPAPTQTPEADTESDSAVSNDAAAASALDPSQPMGNQAAQEQLAAAGEASGGLLTGGPDGKEAEAALARFRAAGGRARACAADALTGIQEAGAAIQVGDYAAFRQRAGTATTDVQTAAFWLEQPVPDALAFLWTEADVQVGRASDDPIRLAVSGVQQEVRDAIQAAGFQARVAWQLRYGEQATEGLPAGPSGSDGAALVAWMDARRAKVEEVLVRVEEVRAWGDHLATLIADADLLGIAGWQDHYPLAGTRGEAYAYLAAVLTESGLPDVHARDPKLVSWEIVAEQRGVPVDRLLFVEERADEVCRLLSTWNTQRHDLERPDPDRGRPDEQTAERLEALIDDTSPPERDFLFRIIRSKGYYSLLDEYLQGGLAELREGAEDYQQASGDPTATPDLTGTAGLLARTWRTHVSAFTWGAVSSLPWIGPKLDAEYGAAIRKGLAGDFEEAGFHRSEAEIALFIDQLAGKVEGGLFLAYVTGGGAAAKSVLAGSASQLQQVQAALQATFGVVAATEATWTATTGKNMHTGLEVSKEERALAWVTVLLSTMGYSNQAKVNSAPMRAPLGKSVVPDAGIVRVKGYEIDIAQLPQQLADATKLGLGAWVPTEKLCTAIASGEPVRVDDVKSFVTATSTLLVALSKPTAAKGSDARAQAIAQKARAAKAKVDELDRTLAALPPEAAAKTLPDVRSSDQIVDQRVREAAQALDELFATLGS